MACKQCSKTLHCMLPGVTLGLVCVTVYNVAQIFTFSEQIEGARVPEVKGRELA